MLEAWKAILALKTMHKSVDLVGVSNVYDPRLLRYLTEVLTGSKNEQHMKEGLLAEHIDLSSLDDAVNDILATLQG